MNLIDRYENMTYSRCGRSGLLLPKISLGLWQNFGASHPFAGARKLVLKAFDLGITHFDLANNYGPPPGEAEVTFGKILREDLRDYRDELIISTKAGFTMWPGPYGDRGSRKSLIASLDQSLKRMKLDYVDIFYHHRPDAETPLEETMAALDHIVRSGKALYVGVSHYSPELTRKAAGMLRDLGTPLLIHQPNYNMFARYAEDGLFQTLADEGIGAIAFSPLAQGLLTNRYLNGIPEDSRIGMKSQFLKEENLTEDRLAKARKLNYLGEKMGITLAQLAILWVIRNKAVTSVLIGASKTSQIEELVAVQQRDLLTEDEENAIENILK